MKRPAELFSKYLKQRTTMQLATISNNKPWVCTVRYVSDEENNIYWMSIPSRRHSKEIAESANVSCAIVVQDMIDRPVIGIQIEGKAELIASPEKYHGIAEQYAEKFIRSPKWVEDFIKGNTEHRLYRLTPTSIYLFDDENFPFGQHQKVK